MLPRLVITMETINNIQNDKLKFSLKVSEPVNYDQYLVKLYRENGNERSEAEVNEE